MYKFYSSLSDILLSPPLASCKLNTLVGNWPGFCCALAAALLVGLEPYIIRWVGGGLPIPDNTGEPVNDTDGETARRLKLLLLNC
jgi:hypothetical protein